MIRLFLLICVFSPMLANADVFKINDDGALDANFTSMFKDPFDYGSEQVKRKASRQINFDKSIAHQVSDDLPKAQYDMTKFMNSVRNSPLMLLQYSSPAAADLFKHYQTIAHLKLGMFYSDFKDLEKGLQVDLDYLRDQAEVECVKSKLAGGDFEGDAIDVMLSCRDGKSSASNGVFASLNYPDLKRTINVFEKVLNRLSIRGEQKDDMLTILPKWEINPDGYKVQGALKRIGHVFADNRQRMMDQMDEVIKGYAQEKTADQEALNGLSLPGSSFTEQNIRDLLSLREDERKRLISRWASQLAFTQTIDRYDQTIEVLKHALTHPLLEEAYKNIVSKGVDFLHQEKASLDREHQDIIKYADNMKYLLDAGEKERLEAIADINKMRSARDSKENLL